NFFRTGPKVVRILKQVLLNLEEATCIQGGATSNVRDCECECFLLGVELRGSASSWDAVPYGVQYWEPVRTCLVTSFSRQSTRRPREPRSHGRQHERANRGERLPP